MLDNCIYPDVLGCKGLDSRRCTLRNGIEGLTLRVSSFCRVLYSERVLDGQQDTANTETLIRDFEKLDTVFV